MKPAFYRQYVDDIFVLFSSSDQAEKFKKYLSSKHPNIHFSSEKKLIVYLFLTSIIFCEKGKIVTNFYQEKTFSGVYNNFNSFIPETYNTGLIKSMLLRITLSKNRYPRDLVDK